MELLDDEINDLGNLNNSDQDFVQKYMMDPENLQNKEQFMLKFFVEYEYPESQSYLKSYWKNLVHQTLSTHFNSPSSK